MEEEKKILEDLKIRYRAERKKLAQARLEKKASNPSARYHHFTGKLVAARKAGLFADAQHELYAVDKLLEGDELSITERNSLNRRRKTLLKRIEQDLTTPRK